MLDHLERLPSPQRDALRIVFGQLTGAVPRRFVCAANGPLDAAVFGQIIHESHGNPLALGEALEFEPGLNVVFGNNGAGKSGYPAPTSCLSLSGARGMLRDVV
jgi:hypothetical protein